MPFPRDILRAVKTGARVLMPAAFASVLPLATHAQGIEENMARAEAFMLTCASRFPETRETTEVLQSEGWRFEGTDGDFRFFTQNGRRVIAGTSTTGRQEQGCLAAVSRLTNEGAIVLAGRVAQKLGFRQVEPPLRGTLATYVGVVNGRPVGVGAVEPDDYYYMRGAGVTFGELVPLP